MKSYTDLEQSKKLAKILPLKSADMCYPKDEFEYNYAKEPVCHYSGIGLAHPCWSLAALLSVLPNEIITNNKFECHYQIHIRKYDGGDNITLHQIAYGNNRGSSGSWNDMINTGEKENLLDAAFEMICWLKENNKI